jgi:hypothetical protein
MNAPEGRAQSRIRRSNAHIRATGISVHHSLGNCKIDMESEDRAVVDG